LEVTDSRRPAGEGVGYGDLRFTRVAVGLLRDLAGIFPHNLLIRLEAKKFDGYLTDIRRISTDTLPLTR